MNKPKPQGRPEIPRVLSASECAHRTGLTVRTLRVYERAGLLTPQRDAKGWRVYGERDIQRLSCIITLKTLGLTLREIRGVLSTAPPPLTQVLQLQLESWLARQAEAERALVQLRAALARLGASEDLSVEELCELVKSAERTQSARTSTYRELVNELITPEEEREYLTWVSEHPNYTKSMQSFTEAQRPLLEELEELRLKGVDPASARVQGIVDRHSELLTRHRVREHTVDLMAWNPAVTRKYLALGNRWRDRMLSKAPQREAPCEPLGGFLGFFSAALRTSKTTLALQPVLEAARVLARQGVPRTSRKAQQLAIQLIAICRQHQLGCPVAWALFTAVMGRTEQDGENAELDAQEQATYRFLADAVRALPARRKTSVNRI